MIAEVIVDIAHSEVDKIFDYILPAELGAVAGCRVLVPFGPRDIEGYIISVKETSDYDKDKLKAVERVLDRRPVILPEHLALMREMAGRYNLRFVDALRLFIPSEMRKARVKELVRHYVTLNPEFAGKEPDTFLRKSAGAQREIVEYLQSNGGEFRHELTKNFSAAALRQLADKDIVIITEEAERRVPYKADLYREGKRVTLTARQGEVADAVCGSAGTYLLHGVTGSGKTEVYMACIEDALSKGRTAIMLVPEISLTPQVFSLFRQRFGGEAAILHSGLSAGERFDEWHRLLTGEARIAVGARSAIFAPLENVGLIIIDEEHDGSYISENSPRYFTHDIAAFRARYNNCSLVLGSATPSIESYYKAEQGEYTLLNMPDRINKKPLPEMHIVDMRKEFRSGNTGIFSSLFLKALEDCIKEGDQAMVFINRRGHSSFMMCRACGFTAKCRDCDVSLVYHESDNTLKCHYCKNSYDVLTECPECGSEHLRLGNVGTQRVARELAKIFPGVKILRMDNDTTRTKDAHLNILSDFAARNAQILVGTQMIAKGHDFPGVTIVGILDADLSLHFSDYRSSERTFQIVTQVAGRAGRDSKEGNVVLQTYSPKHYVYVYAQNNDYVNFYKKECNIREVTKFPPFSVIVRVMYVSESEYEIGTLLKPAFDAIRELAAKNKESFAYLNYMRSPVKRISGKHRFQILARITSNSYNIIKEIYGIIDGARSKNVSVFVELNPQNLN